MNNVYKSLASIGHTTKFSVTRVYEAIMPFS